MTLDIYESIKSISEKIYYTYVTLAKEEINNGTNTIKYTELLKSINILKQIESSIYKKIKNEEVLKELIIKLYQETKEEINIEKPLHSKEKIIFNDNLREKTVYMRISNKLFNILAKNYENDKIYLVSQNNTDKYFLNILDEIILEQKNDYYKNILINSKYEYAFINSNEEDNLKLDEDYEEIISSKIFLEITKYIKKISVLSEKSFFHPLNSRRILLTFTYVRSLLIQINEEDYKHLKETINIMLEHEIIKNSYGTMCFIAMLDYYYEDKRKYTQNGYSFKRKI